MQSDVVSLARALLGKIIHVRHNEGLVSGKIVETEAYCGATDRACHAFSDKYTKRTSTLYMQGGTAYVYLVYGMHHLFNIVTNKSGKADAVLIRAIEPMNGLGIMQKRRGVSSMNKMLSGGPARLTQALGITVVDDKTDLLGDKIWLTHGEVVNDELIEESTRIGVEYAGPDALLPWRFYIRGNKFVSK